MRIPLILIFSLAMTFLGCSSASTQNLDSASVNSSSREGAKKSQTIALPGGEMVESSGEAVEDNYTQVEDFTRGLGFGKETPLDHQLENHEFYVENFSQANKDQAEQRKLASQKTANSSGSANYTLQFATIGNFDAAQASKFELEEKYGLNLYLKFDPPFYKLQAGHYTDKQAAEDRAADLRDSGISAFVVKLK